MLKVLSQTVGFVDAPSNNQGVAQGRGESYSILGVLPGVQHENTNIRNRQDGWYIAHSNVLDDTAIDAQEERTKKGKGKAAPAPACPKPVQAKVEKPVPVLGLIGLMPLASERNELADGDDTHTGTAGFVRMGLQLQKMQ